MHDFHYNVFRLQGNTSKTFKKCKQTYYEIFLYFCNFVDQKQNSKIEWNSQLPQNDVQKYLTKGHEQVFYHFLCAKNQCLFDNLTIHPYFHTWLHPNAACTSPSMHKRVKFFLMKHSCFYSPLVSLYCTYSITTY